MLRKMYLPVALVMIAVMLGAAGCATQKLLPCTVELGYIANKWAGEEVVIFDVPLTVKNPNSIPITLYSLDYALAVNDKSLGMTTSIPGVFIPANDKVVLTYTNFVAFSEGVGMPNYYAGKDYVTAHVAAVPTWKLLEGKEPNFWAYPALGMLASIKGGVALEKIQGTVNAVQGGVDKAWAAAPAGPAVYTVKGKASISSSQGTMDVPFELSYTRP
jgi:hypothetical protein